MRKVIYISSVTLIVSLATALIGYLILSSAEQTQIQYINSTELAAQLRQKNFSLVNVHTPYDGEIDKTDSFLPYNKIDNSVGKLPRDKNAKIIVYCLSGTMSKTAAKKLLELGYKQVYELSGGMDAWRESGYKIINRKGSS